MTSRGGIAAPEPIALGYGIGRWSYAVIVFERFINEARRVVVLAAEEGGASSRTTSDLSIRSSVLSARMTVSRRGPSLVTARHWRSLEPKSGVSSGVADQTIGSHSVHAEGEVFWTGGARRRTSRRCDRRTSSQRDASWFATTAAQGRRGRPAYGHRSATRLVVPDR